MSEEILRALMQLFAIIAKQDEGVESNEIKYVQHFLTTQLSATAAVEYMDLFNHMSGGNLDDGEGERKKGRLTTVSESVKILGICKKINKRLNQLQKVVVLMRLFELVNADRKFSDQRMAIINTVAEVFNIVKEEFKSIENFVIYNTPDKLDIPSVLIVHDHPQKWENCRDIVSEGLDGQIIILQVRSVDLYFLRYNGNQELSLNGLTLNPQNIYLFASGSTLRLPKGKPVYYSDVVANFMADSNIVKLSFVVDNLEFRFPNNEIGLRNIAFSEEHGKLIGIMGASGSGKTTMLNVLSGINKPYSGEVRINGINIHKDSDLVEGIIGYIPQDDLLIEELTVFQNLYFSAKQSFNNKSEEEIIGLVDTTLKSLGLYYRKDLKVGSPLNKLISGGQRKRLNIALELIREPSILFVDEPTSGLSSRDSENVMDLLRELTLKGKLIFVVIHQPSSEIYKMFDKIMILDTGGYMVFYGNPVEAVMHFKRIDNQINSDVGECPTCGNVNPEIIFNIIEAQVVDEFGNYTEQRKVMPPSWEQHFHKNVELPSIEEEADKPESNLNIPNWINQLRIYLRRDVKSKISNLQYVVLNLLEAPLLALILAFIIRYKADPKTGIYVFFLNENIPIYIFMSLICALFLGLIVSAEEIYRDRKILKREKFLNLSRSSYLVSKVGILFTISAIQSLLFVLIGNAMLGYREMYWDYIYVMFVTSACANMMGLNISSAFNSPVTIYILIPLLMIPQMTLGGAMFSFEKMNSRIGGGDRVPLIAELMTTRWAYEALMVRTFKDNRYEEIFYKYDKKVSIADIKQTYYIPELINHLERSLSGIDSPEDSIRQRVAEDLALLRTEIAKEQESLEKLEIARIEEEKVKRKMQTFNFSYANKLTPKHFDEEVYDSTLAYFKRLDSYYGKMLNEALDAKDKLTDYLDSKYPDYTNHLRKGYHNEALQNIVKKVNEKYAILEYGDQLIQRKDPIFREPLPEGRFDFRCHYYSPHKYFAGRFWDTFNFNIIAIWVLTILFYITLYFDVLRRSLDFFGKINLSKYLTKMKGSKPVLPKTSPTKAGSKNKGTNKK